MQWKHKLNHENRLGTKLTGSAFCKLFFNDCFYVYEYVYRLKKASW